MAPSRGTASKQKSKAPNKAKKPSGTPSKPSTSSTAASALPAPPIALCQKLLSTFRTAFPSTFDDHLHTHLQEIKKHLFNREFELAFGRQELLEAYAIRWSASRALGYVKIFEEAFSFLDSCDVSQEAETAPGSQNQPSREGEKEEGQTNPSTKTVICLGGGAGAEFVALAGFWQSQNTTEHLMVHAVDFAPWSNTLQKLYQAVTTAPPISAYASASVRAASAPLVSPQQLSYQFSHFNVLEAEHEAELIKLIGEADVLTLMFTLNELYNSSLGRTQRILQLVTEYARDGAVLVVVDSPGSYAEVSVGKEGNQKTYPMHFLLDYTLIGDGATAGENKGGTSVKAWKKVVDEQSRWFRLPEDLKYPIELENMRFQTHIYTRIRGSPS